MSFTPHITIRLPPSYPVSSIEHSEKELQKIVADRAFGESVLTIMPSLKSEKWQLVHADMTTPLEHKPTTPLTMLQKRWLKAISLDPRVKLFGMMAQQQT